MEVFTIRSEFAEGKDEVLNTFTVKGYKSWRGRDGIGAQATVYKDGKRIGWVSDEGNGGETDFHASGDDFWMVKGFLATLPEHTFKDFWKTQYREEWEHDDGSELQGWSVHLFADVMLGQAEEEQQLRKACRTKILVRYKGEHGFREFHAKWPKDTYGQVMIMSKLVKQVQPNVIAEFINKRFS